MVITEGTHLVADINTLNRNKYPVASPHRLHIFKATVSECFCSHSPVCPLFRGRRSEFTGQQNKTVLLIWVFKHGLCINTLNPSVAWLQQISHYYKIRERIRVKWCFKFQTNPSDHLKWVKSSKQYCIETQVYSCRGIEKYKIVSLIAII